MGTMTPGAEGRRTIVAAAMLLLLVAAVYWPAAGFGFVPFDDDFYVYRNPFVLGGLTGPNVAWAFTTLHAGYWIPLTWLSLMADASAWGAWAGGYHLTNVALHAAAALLFFLLLRRLLGATGVPLLAAALFAAHPLHVESVAWVTERKDVLAQALFLLFLHAWLSQRRRPARGRLAVALLLLSLALMAKPTAATVPVLLLVLDAWPLGRLRVGGWRGLPALAAEKLPVAAVAILFGVGAVVTQRSFGALAPLEVYSPLKRASNVAVTLAQNLGRMLWPADLSPFYPTPPGGAFPPLAAAAAVLLLAALAAAALLPRRSQPWLGAALAWYLVGFAPLSGALQAGSQVTADRFTYLPLLLPHAAAFLTLRAAWPRNCPARTVALALLPALFALAAHRQALFWRDGVTLFRRAVAVSRETSFIRNNLGVALLDADRRAEALQEFETALRLNPNDVGALLNLGGVLVDLGRTDEAEAHLRRAVEIEGGSGGARATLGDMLQTVGRLAEAEQEYRAALTAAPESGPPLRGLASLRLVQGRFLEARDLASAAARRDPAEARVWYVLGTASARLGDPRVAERHLRKALLLRPDYADAGYNLALSLLDQGRRPEASELLEELVQRHPGDAGITGLRESLLRDAAAGGNMR